MIWKEKERIWQVRCFLVLFLCSELIVFVWIAVISEAGTFTKRNFVIFLKALIFKQCISLTAERKSFLFFNRTHTLHFYGHKFILKIIPIWKHQAVIIPLLQKLQDFDELNCSKSVIAWNDSSISFEFVFALLMSDCFKKDSERFSLITCWNTEAAALQLSWYVAILLWFVNTKGGPHRELVSALLQGQAWGHKIRDADERGSCCRSDELEWILGYCGGLSVTPTKTLLLFGLNSNYDTYALKTLKCKLFLHQSDLIFCFVFQIGT